MSTALTRLAEEIPFDSECNQQEQYRLRFAFDVLAHNEDRNETILCSKSGYLLHSIDPSRASRKTARRPKQYAKARLRVSDLLRTELEALESETLQQELGRYLHPGQIEGILKRT